MKQLKLLLAVGIPVLLAVGGWLVLRSLSSPDPARVGGAGPATGPGERTGGGVAPLDPIPPEEWPKVERPRGNATLVPRVRDVPDVDEGEELTPELLDELLAEGTDEAWRRIQELLKEGIVTEPEATARRLVKALAEGGNEALYARHTLVLLRDDHARELARRELLALAGRSRDTQTLSAAFETIGELGDAGSVEPLAAFARNLDDRAAATQAIYAIARIGAPESAHELARLLAEKQGTDLADAIVMAVGRVKTPEMVDALRPLVSADQTPELRLTATRALGLTRSGEAVAPLQAIAAGEGDSALRAAAVEGLGHIGTEAAVEELLRLRKGGGELAYTAGLALGLTNVKDPAAKVILRELDGEADVRIRVSMIRALEGSAAEGVREKLGAYLASPSEPEAIRSYSARSLGGTGDPAVVAPLTSALEKSPAGEQDLRTSILRSFFQLTKVPAARDAMREKTLPVIQGLLADKPTEQEAFWLQRLANELQR